MTRLCEYRVAIAALTALLLFVVIAVPVSASPLTISSVAAGSITDTSATITWTTDEPADSVVNYGNTTALGSAVSDSALITDHAMSLTNLTPATLYYYEVSSTNAGGNTTVDNNGGAYYTLTTAAPPDTTPPTISSVAAGSITETSATITWTTDEPADSVVNYGNTTALGLTASDASLVTSHSVSLGSLDPTTTYYYEVQSTDGVGNTASDNNGGAYYTFTTAATPDTTPPMISSVAAGSITDTSATITWTTDEPADSVVNYGNTTALGLTASDASLVTSHSVSLGSLDPATTYYYEVQSTDGVGNTASDNNGGAYYTFTAATPPDTTPPTISEVAARNITDTSVTITWTTDEPADSVVNYGNTTALGLAASDATLVTSHSITLNGLLRGTTYYFEVQSTDGAGNTATDNNEGAYYLYILTTLTGWGWCTDYTEIANAEFVANGMLVPRIDAPGSSDLHLVGNVTLTLSDATTETIDLDMYGIKVRSFFYGHQEEEGKSASFNGVWLAGDGGDYLSAWGRITLPQGEVFKTAKVYLLKLRTTGIEIPDREPDGFVADLEYAIAVFTNYIDELIDKLMSSDFAEIISGVLGKIMVLLAAVREMGVPYIP